MGCTGSSPRHRLQQLEAWAEVVAGDDEVQGDGFLGIVMGCGSSLVAEKQEWSWLVRLLVYPLTLVGSRRKLWSSRTLMTNVAVGGSAARFWRWYFYFFLTDSFLGAERRICRFLRAVAFLGVAGLLHARTLLATRLGLLLVGASLDVSRRFLCMICRIHWWTGLRGNVLGDVDSVGAAARHRENALGVRWSTSSNSRPERGPELREGGRNEACFSSAAVRKDACRDVGRCCKSLNLRISRNKKSREGVLCRGSLLGLLVSLLCYLGQAVTLG